MNALPIFDPPELPAPVAERFAPFWAAVEREALALPRCSACGRWQWYPEDGGPHCPDAELVWQDVATTGTLHARTRVHRSFLPTPEPIADPFLVGLIELDGVEGVRLVANLTEDVNGRSPAIGDRVVARFAHLGHRRHPVFMPVPEAMF